MLFLYNLCQLVLLALLAPFWIPVCMLPKYRGRVLGRLGWGLSGMLPGQGGSPRIWVHALSVGEVNSSMPLVRALRKRYPLGTLIFSTTTRGGAERACALAGEVDALVPFPLDLSIVVRWFLRHLRPDLFLLVETDFWPNLLFTLQRKRVPFLLVNGRVSGESFSRYRNFGPFFRKMFAAFSGLVVQSGEDRDRMLALGVSGDKVHVLGNLKYDCLNGALGGTAPPGHPAIPEGVPYWVAGSTHAGEEEILLQTHRQLTDRFGPLLLVLAPRDVRRAHDVLKLAKEQLFVVQLSSKGSAGSAQVLILDRMGELLAAYARATFAFVGGSLVDEGGHNPLEPAALGRPVLFGPYMHDFPDVVRDVLEAFPEARVRDGEELLSQAGRLLSREEFRQAVGLKLREMVRSRSGVVARYLMLIQGLGNKLEQ